MNRNIIPNLIVYFMLIVEADDSGGFFKQSARKSNNAAINGTHHLITYYRFKTYWTTSFGNNSYSYKHQGRSSPHSTARSNFSDLSTSEIMRRLREKSDYEKNFRETKELNALGDYNAFSRPRSSAVHYSLSCCFWCWCGNTNSWNVTYNNYRFNRKFRCGRSF